MTPELMDDYRKELLENIEAEMKEEGSVSAFVQIMGEKEGVDKPVIVHIVTNFGGDDDKEFFIEEAIPQICKKLKKSEITPHQVVFVSEVWVHKIDKKTGEKTKEEAVMIAISSDKGEILEAYDIIRHTYEVDEKGELSSRIELKKNEDLSGPTPESEGRFSNLYRTLMDEFNKQ